MITGLNGAGKTSLLEAVAYLATLQSFRGSPTGGDGPPGRRAGHPAGRDHGGRPPGDHRGGAVDRRPVPDHGQPAGGPPTRRPARGPPDHGVLARGHRGGPVRARPSAGGSSTRPWRWSIPRRPGRSRTWTGSSASGRPCCGSGGTAALGRGGQHPRRVGHAARRRPGPRWWRPERPWSSSWPRSPRSTTPDWPASSTAVGLDYAAVVVGRAGSRPWPSHGPRTSSEACR